MELLLLQKLKTQIDCAPTITEAHRIYQASQAVDDTIFSYDMAERELDTKGSKPKLKPGPINPEQAGEFATKLTKTVDLFKTRIYSYDRYETEKTYPEFVNIYLKLLSEVEDYYSNAKASIVLDTIPDKMAKMLRIETTREKEEQAKCPNPCTSTDTIPRGHQMLNKLATLANFKTIKSGHKMSIVQLFTTLQ